MKKKSELVIGTNLDVSLLLLKSSQGRFNLFENFQHKT